MKPKLWSVATLFSAAVVLVVTVAVTGVQAVQTDFVAPLGNAIPNANIDGNIDMADWSDANTYTMVPINPAGTSAVVSIKHDNLNLYIAVVWQADIPQPWFSIELDAIGCMNNGADGALFGNDGGAKASLGGSWVGGVGPYRDIRFSGVGLANVNADTTQNGVGAIINQGSNLMAAEFKKPLSSGDSAGNDIAWTVGTSYQLLMTWDSNGGGNAGTGSADGMDTTNSQTVQLSSVAIPEFPTTAILLLSVGGTFALVAVAAWRRSKARP